MKFVQLISREIARRCAAPGVEGTRTSPLRLMADEVGGLVEALRADVGGEVHIAISAPDVAHEQSDKLCISPGEEAARAATEWRNTIDSGAGARIVYISHERWGRAGGLEETLRPVTEGDLRRSFRSEAPDPGFPEELAAALDSARVLERVPARALCEFSEEVGASADPFEAAGSALHLLGLAPDSALRPGDALERLRKNAQAVHRAVSNERAAGGGEVHRALTEAVRRGGEAGLAGIDLGSFPTEELGPRSPARTRGAARSKKKRKKKSRRKKKTSGSAPDEGTEPAEYQADHEQATDVLEAALQGTRKQRASALGTLASVIAEAGANETEAPSEQEELARLLGAGYQQEQAGTLELASAMVSGEGWGLTLNMSRAADIRAALRVALPGGVELVARPLASEPLSGQLDEWRAARRGVAAMLSASGAGARASLRGLIRAPLIALSDPELHASATSLLEAARVLYRSVVELGDSDLAREVAGLETTTVDSGGSKLVLLGPLHPLWLGQVMARLEQVRTHTSKLSNVEAHLIARAVSRSPSAPPTADFPEVSGAGLAPVLAGLICYEARPPLAEEAALADIGERLLRVYLRVHPYGSLGLRVRLWGDVPSALLEGLARPLAEDGALAKLELLCTSTPGPASSSAAREALLDGRLALLPASGGSPTPHLELILDPRPTLSTDDRPTAPTVSGFSAGPLATDFTQFRDGLRAVTSVQEVPGVEEFEAVHAVASGWSPRGAFIVEPRGVSLVSALRTTPPAPGVWRAVVGRGVASEVPEGQKLLAYEVLEDGLSVAIVCDTAEPASRALEAPLKNLEVSAPSPRMRRMLADRLCESSRGLLAVGGRQSDQLAGLLLEASLRQDLQACAHVTTTQLSGQTLLALTDIEPETRGAFCLALGLDGSTTHLLVGYAAIEAPLEVKIARGGHMQGELGETLGGILASVEVALGGTGVARACALEAVRWALCPSAAEEHDGSALLDALRTLGASEEVTVQARVLLPPSHEQATRETAVRLKGKEVRFGRLDAQRLDRLILP